MEGVSACDVIQSPVGLKEVQVNWCIALCYGPLKYIDRMVTSYQRMFGNKPSTKFSAPLEKGDHPEINDTELLDEDGIAQYQLLMGVMQR